jgi:schlafen family protein
VEGRSVGGELYEEIVKGGFAWIGEALNVRLSEHLHLEFKTKSESDSPTPNTDDLSNLSKALSGYSNADGGVVIWGVETERKKGAQVDSAKGLALIVDAQAFRDQLYSRLHELVTPAAACQMTAFVAKEGTPAGVVVTYIAAGESVPYMCQRDHRYYGRSGTSTVVLENYQVRDLFTQISARPQARAHSRAGSRHARILVPDLGPKCGARRGAVALSGARPESAGYLRLRT